MLAYNFFVSRPKFTKFFLFNEGWIAIDNAIYHLSIFLCVPEIFAVEVECFSILHQILDVFCPPKFSWGSAPQKLYLR